MRIPLHLRGLAYLLDAGGAPPPATLRYGKHVDQVGDLVTPDGRAPHAVVVLIHGGFWHVPWDRRLMTAIAGDLWRRGFATWNIEYARVGLRRGGWPGTFLDVAAAVDHLAVVGAEYSLNTTRIAVLGHSAGGQLAMWVASRRGLPRDAPGAGPRLRPKLAVSLAGVLDLAKAARHNIGGSAVSAFLGGDPGDETERYRLASPMERLPLGLPQLLMHGGQDEAVPAWLSVEYQAAALRLGDACDLTVVPGEDHMAVIDPRSRSWGEAASWITARL